MSRSPRDFHSAPVNIARELSAMAHNRQLQTRPQLPVTNLHAEGIAFVKMDQLAHCEHERERIYLDGRRHRGTSVALVCRICKNATIVDSTD